MTEELIRVEPLPLTLIAVSPVDLYINSLPMRRSRESMIQALARITDILSDRKSAMSQKENEIRARQFDWAALRAYHFEIIKAKLGDTVKKTTANKMLAAVRGVLTKALMLKQIPYEEYGLIMSIRLFKAKNEVRGRALSEDELASLALVCRNDTSAAGFRDAALMTIAYGAGLRRFEITALDVQDWDEEEKSLRVRHGKMDKERKIYLSDSGKRCIERWLALHPALAMKNAPLLLPVNKGGRVRVQRMTPQAIYSIIEKRRDEAGITHFSPHDMRRSFISDLLDSGVDIASVAGLAGHVNVNMTARYDRRGERAKKAAATKLIISF